MSTYSESEEQFINRMIHDVQSKVSRAYEVRADDVPAGGNEEIAAFWCHKLDRLKARKAVNDLARTMGEDTEAAAAVRDLPLEARAGMGKNRLVAVNDADDPVFVLNLKTGESYFP